MTEETEPPSAATKLSARGRLSRTRALESALFVLCIALLVHGLHLRQRATKLSSDLARQHSDAQQEAGRAASLATQARHLRKLLPYVRLTETVVLRGSMLGGPSMQLALNDLQRPHLLFTIDSKCGSCYENLPFLRELAIEQACQLVVLGISLNDSLPLQVWERGNTRFDILMGSTGPAWETLPLGLPSSLVLVGGKGQLTGWWLGTLDSTAKSEIRGGIKQLCSIDVT